MPRISKIFFHLPRRTTISDWRLNIFDNFVKLITNVDLRSRADLAQRQGVALLLGQMRTAAAWIELKTGILRQKGSSWTPEVTSCIMTASSAAACVLQYFFIN